MMTEMDCLGGGGGGASLVYSLENEASGTSLNTWAYKDTGITVDSNKTYFCGGGTSRAAYVFWQVIKNGSEQYSTIGIGPNTYIKFVVQDGKIKIGYQTTSSITSWNLYAYIYEA